MLSILVPSYNHDLTDLVEGLQLQASESGIVYEILIIDDASAEGFRSRNQSLSELSQVRYLQLDENVGRSRIRNMLAEEARFENLLFIDADAQIIRDDFLSIYIGKLGADQVICGGTAYQADPPCDSAYFLRWYYGRKREERSIHIRSRDQYSAFSSFQFVATKTVLEQVPFDNDLKAYGHEDTVFGLALEKKGIPVIHIDNVLVHEGLEPSDEFLDKTRQGLRNLKFLVDEGRYSGLEQRVRILRKYQVISRFGLQSFLKWFHGITAGWLLKKLNGQKPRLWAFDLYKICYYATLY